MDTIVDVVKVGIAERKIAYAPERLRTSGLGSCVGVVIWDRTVHLAGLIHIMLPVAPERPDIVIDKYADAGIPSLVQQLVQEGAEIGRLRAKIAGGAQMFSAIGSDLLKIGPRNVQAVKETLLELSIPLIAEDTGGKVGRTIEFDVKTEVLQVKTALFGTLDI